ncbi:MAG: transglycosylase SLT domain-containing protein [Pseudomonadota bacterium]
MIRKLLPLFGLLILVACSGGGDRDNPPRNLNDACSMKSQRSGWFKDLDRIERKYQIPKATMLAMMYQESKFVANARTPLQYTLGVIPAGRQSSAYGYAQALDGTWDWYRDETGNRRAQRNDFADAVDFMGWYMTETKRRTGVPLNDTYNQYLAYHDGQTGWLKGTYKRKGWLLKVARNVEERAILYHTQLSFCGG